MVRFNEETIKVSDPNQEMFMGVFQNWLKAGHFNESLVQKQATSMEEVMSRAGCYFNNEESNMEKMSWDAKEKVQPKHEGPESIREHHNLVSRDRSTMSPSRRPYQNFFKNYIPLNTKQTNTLKEVYNLKLLPESYRPRRVNVVLGNDTLAWCAYHWIKGHHT